jgi:hypothetical protein
MTASSRRARGISDAAPPGRLLRSAGIARRPNLADETLNHIARTLEHGELPPRPPARYCHVVARFVLLEDIRRERKTVVLDEPRIVGISQAHARESRGVDPDAVHEATSPASSAVSPA